MAECADAFAIVRKARVAKYEFSGLLTLPGGMVRSRDWPEGETPFDAEKLARYSLHMRAKQEAGLDPSLTKETLEIGLGPIMTSYFAKERQRFALIVVHKCQVKEMLHLASRDRSVDEATWVSTIADWERFAPANMLIVAHLRWARLDADEQEQARSSVEAAAKKCSAWGQSFGFPGVPVPWASSTDLDAWRNGWRVPTN